MVVNRLSNKKLPTEILLGVFWLGLDPAVKNLKLFNNLTRF
jgi:hypothetical protein